MPDRSIVTVDRDDIANSTGEGNAVGGVLTANYALGK